MTDTPETAPVGDVGEVARPAASRGDNAGTAAAFERWLGVRLGHDAAPVVSNLTAPTSSGMSSDTMLFDASWRTDSGTSTRGLAARLAPEANAMPVFAHYDLGLQSAVMQAVAAHSPVPVPHVYWHEPSAEPLGREFIVMERVDGQVPPDVLPYNFESWLFDATPQQRRRLRESSIGVLADLHSIAAPWEVCPALAAGLGPGPVTAAEALHAHLGEQRGYYEWASAGGPRSPLIERALDQLDDTVPDVPGPAVLCWGDARIGNIVYRDFTPYAVLDWEMATLGPGELDLGWMIFMHRFFEDIAAQAGLPGLPDLLRRDESAAHYRRLTGRATAELDWFITYAALRHAVIMYRIQRRTIAFGATPAPAEADDMIMHRRSLERLLAGTYWHDLEQERP